MGANEQERDFRVDVLKAAGFEDAARLLESLPASVAPASVPECEPEPPQRSLTPAEAFEAQQRAAGEALLHEMQRQLGRQWTSVPLDGGN